jgi:hypothetical protein
MIQAIKVKRIPVPLNNSILDEDLQQDLWVAYLSGMPIDLLSQYIQSRQASQYIEDNFKQQIQELIYSSEAVSSGPTPIAEHIVVCLLILGCDVATISQYTGIIEVRIAEIVVTLQEGRYGVKEALYR